MPSGVGSNPTKGYNKPIGVYKEMQSSIWDFFTKNLAITIALFVIMVIVLLFVYIKKYARIYEPDIYYVHLRKGVSIKSGEGGMVIRIPFFDKVLTVNKTVQQLTITSSNILSKEKQHVKITTVLQWQSEKPVATISNIRWADINDRLTAIIESVIRTTCAKLSIEKILEERQEIVEAVKGELEHIIKEWGLKVSTVELTDIEVIQVAFLNNLAKPREVEIARVASLAEIAAEEEVLTRDILREKHIKEKEIERDKEVAVRRQDQLLAKEAAEKRREQEVLEIAMQKDLMQRQYEKKQAEVDASKLREVAIIDAEAEKKRQITEIIEVEAAKRIKEADAEAHKLVTEARGTATSITSIALAEAGKIEAMGAAEGARITAVMLAEAEGIRAKKLAAATGDLKLAEAQEKLRKAQQGYSPQEGLRDFIQQIPAIMSQIDIGDVTFFDGGGSGGSGGEGDGTSRGPMEFFGNSWLPMMLAANMMGLDLRGTLQKGLGAYASKEDVPALVNETGGKKKSSKKDKGK